MEILLLIEKRVLCGQQIIKSQANKYRKKILRYFIIMIFAVLCVVLLWCKLEN